LSDGDVVNLALTDLGRILDLSPERMRSELVAHAFHNWSRDPFARGAYSYVAKGGVPAAREFAEAIDDTLVFAGEATIMGSERGTVSGAIRSGRISVQKLLGEVRTDTNEAAERW
jgi:monoamine oxidase